MTGSLPIGEDDLHAYLDDRLTPECRDAVEDYLASNPAVSARVQADRGAREALRALLHAKAVEPVPPRLRVASIMGARRARRSQRFGAVAAAGAWLLLGGLGGWFGNAWVSPVFTIVTARGVDAVATDAIAAHRLFAAEIAHPVEVAAVQEAHLVQWLSRRLGHPLKVPDLSAQGFQLMGGRLLPAGQAVAAQFMYQDSSGMRATVYVRTNGSATPAFRLAQEANVLAFSWTEEGLAYAIAATTDRKVLLALAEQVFHQLDPAAPLPPVLL